MMTRYTALKAVGFLFLIAASPVREILHQESSDEGENLSCPSAAGQSTLPLAPHVRFNRGDPGFDGSQDLGSEDFVLAKREGN
jgi:hypothetical protein